MPLVKGVSIYLSTIGAAASAFTNHPVNVASIMLKWSAHETAKGTFSSLTEAKLASDLAAAEARGRGVILRLMGGIDSPIGRPGTSQPSWLNTHPTKPVARIRTLDNDPSPALYGGERYVPDLVGATSRANYLDHLSDWYDRIATLTDGSAAIVCVCVPGPENGAEMSIGPGSLGDTVYSGSATLASSITSSTTLPQTVTLAGSYGSYDSDDIILQIGTELIHCTHRSGATVTVGKRGHCGTTPAAHSAGVAVKYASAKVTVTTFNGYGPASFDHRAVNRAAWAALGTEAQAITALTTYWSTASTDMAAALDAGTGVSLAGGQLFGDGLAAADSIIDAIGPGLGARMYALTTNLQDGYNYPSTHPNEHDWLMRAIGHGNYVMAQTASVAVLGQPPDETAFGEFIASCEFALETYGIVILETGAKRFETTATAASDAVGGWDGGTSDSQTSYLTTAA